MHTFFVRSAIKVRPFCWQSWCGNNAAFGKKLWRLLACKGLFSMHQTSASRSPITYTSFLNLKVRTQVAADETNRSWAATRRLLHQKTVQLADSKSQHIRIHRLFYNVRDNQSFVKTVSCFAKNCKASKKCEQTCRVLGVANTYPHLYWTLLTFICA